MRNFLKFFLAAAAVLSAAGCVYYADCSRANNEADIGGKITSLKTVIDDAKEGDTIDLSQYPDIKNYTAEIDKAVTITASKSMSLDNATLTVNADGVSISGISNASVTASSDLGNGSLKISSSSLSSLTINGGGINSIVISDVTVDKVTIDKQKSNDNTSDQYVRLCVDGAANIASLNISSSALIDLSSDSSTDKFDLSAVSIKFTGDNSNDINVAVRKTITVRDVSADQVKAEFSMGGSADGFYIIANKGATIKKDFYQQVSNKIADREIDAEIIPPVVGDSTFDFNTVIKENITVIIHEHTFSDDLTSDETYHWYAATCEHTDQVKDRAEHIWGDGTETTAATCTTAGVRTYACTVCGRTKTETIDATGHAFSDDLTSDGTNHWHICESCGATDTKTAHDWGEWETVTAATTTAQGSKKKTCSVCKKEITETIPMLGAANITVTLAENSDYEISLAKSGTQITVTVPALPSGVTYKLIVDNTTVYETNSFDAEGLASGTHSVIVKFSDGKSSYLTFTLN